MIEFGAAHASAKDVLQTYGQTYLPTSLFSQGGWAGGSTARFGWVYKTYQMIGTIPVLHQHPFQFRIYYGIQLVWAP